jgi:hypothetical protein
MAYNMKDYVTVAQRLQMAHDKGLVSKVVTESPVMLNDVMGYIRVTVEFADGTLATATGSFRMDAKAGAQKTNPLEDAETSAIGRALAFLGISASKSIASKDEIETAMVRDAMPQVSEMQKLIRAVEDMHAVCKTHNLRIDHELASLHLHEMDFDEIVTYGKYLRALTKSVRTAE